jgi:predicted nucleotidyltransferase
LIYDAKNQSGDIMAKVQTRVIFSTLKSLKPKLMEQYHITRIGVFGSVIHGTQTEESDVDVLIEFSDPPGLFKFMEIEELLSDTLKIPVDLVDAEGIKPRLKKRILSEVQYV